MNKVAVLDTIDQVKSDLRGISNLILGLMYLSKELAVQDNELFFLTNCIDEICQKLESIDFNKPTN